MKKKDRLLHAKPLKAKLKDYFNQTKQLFNVFPVFPLLDKKEIEAAVETYVDSNRLRSEIQAIQKHSVNNGAVVPNSTFLIGLVDWHTYPEVIKLLSIVREWAFRNDGGGVGGLDTDEFDLEPNMKQLIIINPNFEDDVSAIVGGYRYMHHKGDSYERGPMGAHFQFSEAVKKQCWIELGRSFINPFYRETKQKESFDCVLYGLGYIYATSKDAKGYFGKVTLYNIYEKQKADKFFLAVARDYFNKSDLMFVNEDERVKEGQIGKLERKRLERDIFKGLFILLRSKYRVNMVPIMAVYNRMIDLRKMHYFGAFRHKAFGNTTEVGIAMEFDNIYDGIKEKFTSQYQK